jgi:hypothetical protein
VLPGYIEMKAAWASAFGIEYIYRMGKNRTVVAHQGNCKNFLHAFAGGNAISPILRE